MFRFLPLVALIGCVLARCPVNFVHNGTSCYIFQTLQMSFDSAQKYCFDHYGAHLATVETKAENTFLTDYLHKNSFTFYGYDLWLGGSDNNPSKHWQWVVTDNSTLTFTDWNPGQPDGSFGGFERCLEYEAAYNLKWNDDECTDNNMFICERPFNPPVPHIQPPGR